VNSLNEIIRLAWARFGIITAIIGEVQGRIVVSLFYFTVLVPFGIGSRLLSDPLHIKGVNNSPKWIAREPVKSALEDAREQG